MQSNEAEGQVPDDDDPILVEWAAEIADRIQSGESVDLSAYARLHPQRAAALRGMIPAIEMLAGLGVSPDRKDRPSTPAEPCEELGHLGDFRLIRQVGRGGMGIVYEAEQVSLRRRVALKVLPFAATLDPRQLQRFQLEAHAAACLHHTHIVPIHAVGTERGVPFYAMQFIDGQSLAELIDDLRRLEGREPVLASTQDAAEGKPASSTTSGATRKVEIGSGSVTRGRAHVRNAARLALETAEALDHAHTRGILHRDIKPGNLLIDTQGSLWVADFGLAQVQGDHGLTLTGDIMGTLRYMSPEQALARRTVIDARTDIYSLGVTLYELLTLRNAFDGKDRAEILRKIAQDEPTPLRALNPSVPVDLETIVTKAISKAPADRYSTANDFAEDLRRFLDSRPIVARRPSLLDRATKWAVRHRTATVGAAVVVATILLVTTTAAVIVASKEHERGQAAVAVGDLQTRLRLQAEEQAEQGRHRQARLNVDQGVRLMEDGDLPGAHRHFVEALRLDEGDAEKVADHRLRLGMLLSQCAKPTWIWFQDQPIDAVALRPDGRAAAVALRDGTITVYDAISGRPLGPSFVQQAPIGTIEFSPDGKRIAVARGDQEVRVLDVASGRESFPPLVHSERVYELDFSPDGKLLLTTLRTRRPDYPTWRVWDAETGLPVTDWMTSDFAVSAHFSPDSKLVAVPNGHNLLIYDARSGRQVAPPMPHGSTPTLTTYNSFSPDSRRVVTGCVDNVARVWDVATGQLTASMQHKQWVQASFSPDGRRVLTSCTDGTARAWDSKTGAATCDPLHHPGVVKNAVSSPDGTLVATICDDHAVRVWDAATGRAVLPPLRHLGTLLATQFTADGRYLFTASADRTIRFWDLAAASPAGPRLLVPGRDFRAAFGSGGKVLITHGAGGTARVWDVVSGRALGSPVSFDAQWLPLGRVSPDGRSYAIVGGQSDHRYAAWVWNIETRQTEIGPLVVDFKKSAGDTNRSLIAWSSDGRRVAVAAGSDEFFSPANTVVRIWDAKTGSPVTPELNYNGVVYTLDFSPDVRSLVTASRMSTGNDEVGEVVIVDVETGARKGSPIRTSTACTIARFSPDGQRLLVVSEGVRDVNGSDIRILDAVSGRPLTPSIHHEAVIGNAFFTRDGGRVVTTSDAVRVWDAETGTQLGSPIEFSLPIGHASLDAEGRRLLVTCGWPGSYAIDPGFVKVVDLETGNPLTPPLWRERFVQGAAFSPDGRRIVTTCLEGGILFWDLSPDARLLESLVQTAEVLSGTRVDGSGASIPITTDELREAYNTLRIKDPNAFSASDEQVIGWHHERLQACEAARSYSAALVHIDALLATGQSSDSLIGRRARTLAELGRWKEAVEGFASVVHSDPRRAVDWYSLALAHLGAGDRDGYRATCVKMLDTFGSADPSSDDILYTLKACTLAKEAPAASTIAADFAKRVRIARPNDQASLLVALGILHYRAGAFEKAAETLSEADRQAGTLKSASVDTWYILAMAHHHLRHPEESKKWADRALAATKPILDDVGQLGGDQTDWRRGLTLQLLRHELESLRASDTSRH